MINTDTAIALIEEHVHEYTVWDVSRQTGVSVDKINELLMSRPDLADKMAYLKKGRPPKWLTSKSIAVDEHGYKEIVETPKTTGLPQADQLFLQNRDLVQDLAQRRQPLSVYRKIRQLGQNSAATAAIIELQNKLLEEKDKRLELLERRKIG